MFLVSCFIVLIMSRKAVLCYTEWSNELLEVNSARPSGLAKYYHRPELSVLITSQLKIRWISE